MKSRLAIYAIVMILALSSIGPASGLKVDGAILMKDVVPGEHIRHEADVSIEENSDPTTVTVKLFGYGMNPRDPRVQLDTYEDMGHYSAAGFLSVTPESSPLEPGTIVKFFIEGDIPEDVGSGGRYALVNVQTAPQGSGSIGVISAIVIPVFLTIKDTDLVETGEITDLTVSEGNEGFVASASFENTGNHHYGTSTTAVLKDEAGSVLAENSKNGVTMIPSFTYAFNIEFDPEIDLAPGTYTVEASVIKSDGKVMDTEEATFEV